MEDKKSHTISLLQPNGNDFVQKKLPPIEQKVKINYENLLLLSKEVEEREVISREDAHQTFMKNYHSIFQHEPRAKSTLHSSLAKKPQKIPKPLSIKDDSHNITEHLSKLHRQRSNPAKDERIGDLMKKIRKHSKKPPYERSSKENQQLLKCLFDVKCLSHFPKRVIEKLVTTAHLEHWDPDFTVFGESGLYLIVKGTCVPSDSYRMNQSPMMSRIESHVSLDNTSESHSLQKASMLYPGDHFGKLKIDGDDVNESIMSVVTLEECEILRFSNASFQRVSKHIRDKKYGNKLQLAQSCKLFKDWPKLSLKRISEIFQWAVAHPGETLELEGTVASRVCFIKKGDCQLKKVLSIASTNPDGKTVRRKQEVVIGNLGPGDSFGEKSFIKSAPLEQSVVAEKKLIIASIGVEDIEGLDDVTKALFRQTCEAADSKTSKETIKKNYTEKQAELEWNSKKEEIVSDILYYNGIMPGYSKWSRNPKIEDVQHLKDTKKT